MSLSTREEATHKWQTADLNVQFQDLLQAFECYKDISIEGGLNASVHQGWRIGDPHKKKGKVDRHDYDILLADGQEVLPGPSWHSLYRWLVSQADEFYPYDSVYVVTDNRDLVSAGVHDQASLAHWPMVAAWWKERLQYTGPYAERTNVVFVPISVDTGLDKTWAGPYILNACVYLFPLTNVALIDSDCVPVTLFELQELWHSSDHLEQSSGDTPHVEPDPSSSIAPAHKRSRSVDAGKADQPSEPPIKLSKSRSVENFLPCQRTDRRHLHQGH